MDKDKGLVIKDYSVLMSVYKNDNPEQVSEAIESMLSQTISPEQFVIVIDGPISKELCDLISNYSKNSLFDIVWIKQNGGLGNALNQGIKQCRNELIARMDADDISKPCRCEKQLRCFNLDPQYDIVGTQIEEFQCSINNVVSTRPVPLTHRDIVKFSKRRSPFNHPTVMYKKSAVEKVGGYDSYGRKEDLDLFIRMLNNNCKACNLDESLLYYRVGTDNIKRRKTWKNCKEYVAVMRKYYKKKYIGLFDLLYVIVGQVAMFILPLGIVKRLSNVFLRKRIKNS